MPKEYRTIQEVAGPLIDVYKRQIPDFWPWDLPLELSHQL